MCDHRIKGGCTWKDSKRRLPSTSRPARWRARPSVQCSPTPKPCVTSSARSTNSNCPVRSNVTIDLTLRENVRANLRVLVRRILHKHGYPPDKQEKATMTVLEQAEVLSEGWGPSP